jgi:hypothetical protein
VTFHNGRWRRAHERCLKDGREIGRQYDNQPSRAQVTQSPGHQTHARMAREFRPAAAKS